MTQNVTHGVQGKLGAKLRELRMEQNLSLRTLASRTGFSPSFLSQVESELVSPSLASLEKIASELGVTLAQLFSSLEDAPRTVVRADERVTYESSWSHSTVTALTDPATGRKLVAVLVTFAPGGASGKQPTVLQQDTIALIVDGTLTLILDGDQLNLEEGDSVYLNAGSRCTWTNQSAEQAAVLLVSGAGHSVYPPPSPAQET